MYTHILVPTDGSDLSAKAGQRAIALADVFKAKLTAVTVTPTLKQMTDEGFAGPPSQVNREKWEKQAGERASRILDGLAVEAKRAGVPCETVHAFRDLPYEAIIDTAEKHGCDLIVMGSHGHGGFKQFLLGSETTRVLSHTTIPVLVYR
jgi:nucleotide-binding universal stress UspA family protein